MSFGFGFGFPSWRTLAGGFSPAALFVGGVQGAWYDPSDLSTMFDTSAGTTPVAMPGLGAPVPVGLMLDKSQGLVLGPELVTNGDFSGGTTGWSSFASVGTSSIAVVSGELQATTSVSQGASGARQVLTGLTSGRWYKVVGTVRVINNQGVADVAATIRWANGNVTTGYSTLVSSTSISPTQISGYFLAGNSTVTLFLVNGGSGLTPSSYVTGYDNISVKELPGNHAIAFNDTTARPELRARVNLLTYSEEFDNGAWVKGNVTVTANAAVAPDGTNTADLMYPNTNGTLRWVYQTLTSGSAIYTRSFYAKAQNKSIIYIDFTGAGTAFAYFNLSNGTVGTVSAGYTATITPVGNGWYRCTGINTSAQAISFSGIYGVADADGSTSVTANGTDGIYLWGAQLIQTNAFPANTYQRIADANTYDTSGFPLYLRFDGIDDSMTHTFGINANVTLMCAARRAGGTGEQGLLGVTPPSTRIVGLITANAVNPNWGTYAGPTFQSSGQSLLETNLVATNVAEPNIPSQKLYTNQSLSATITGTLYAGDGNERRIIGNDNTSASRWYFGNLYGAIAVAKVLTDAERTASVTWLGNKMGQSI